MKRKFIYFLGDCDTYPQTAYFHLIPLFKIILFIRHNPFSDCCLYVNLKEIHWTEYGLQSRQELMSLYTNIF